MEVRKAGPPRTGRGTVPDANPNPNPNCKVTSRLLFDNCWGAFFFDFSTNSLERVVVAVVVGHDGAGGFQVIVVDNGLRGVVAVAIVGLREDIRERF